MKYGLYNENGVLEQYVHVSDEGHLERVELPPGYTIRDAEGAVVEFEDPAVILVEAIKADLDSVANRLDELEELINDG